MILPRSSFRPNRRAADSVMEVGAMPREQITYAQADSPHVQPELHVSWNKAGSMPGHVQVAIETNRPALATYLAEDETAIVGVYTEVLSRGDINRLIQVLRRARDQAYGRDE